MDIFQTKFEPNLEFYISKNMFQSKVIYTITIDLTVLNVFVIL